MTTLHAPKTQSYQKGQIMFRPGSDTVEYLKRLGREWGCNEHECAKRLTLNSMCGFDLDAVEFIQALSERPAYQRGAQPYARACADMRLTFQAMATALRCDGELPVEVELEAMRAVGIKGFRSESGVGEMLSHAVFSAFQRWTPPTKESKK